MENNENTEKDSNARSPRHQGRGALWIVVLLGTAIALGTAGYMGHAVASGGFDGWKRGGHHGAGHGGRGEMMFKTFDTNKDGTITTAEIEAATQQRLNDNDANGDGALSLEEFQGVWMEMLRERMVDAFQRFDEDGDGVITKAEVDEKTSWMLSRMDRNDDGQITREEMRPRFRRGEGERFDGPKED